jgi:16S rRNA (uracil1498-N3)-methyltransferase
VRHSRRDVRLFIDASLEGDTLLLADSDAHYLANVLRLRVGDRVTVFNGRGQEWRAEVRILARKHGALALIEPAAPLRESALELILVQALVKAEAMDAIVQKATELGVTAVWPVMTEFSVVRLDEERGARRLAHWQRITRSACEQSGRHTPAVIRPPCELGDCLAALEASDVKLVLDPLATVPPRLPAHASSATVVVGPEGGFGPGDTALLERAGCQRLRLGGRILRADTAALTICALAQQRWGDLG